MNSYTNPKWKSLLEDNNISQFDLLWKLPKNSKNEVNYRGRGWSMVTKLVVAGAEKATCSLYIKRQQDYFTRTWLHPLMGALTFTREYNNIRLCQKHGIPVVEPIFYSNRSVGSKRQAILITRGLDSHKTLSEVLSGEITETQKRSIIKAVARTVSIIHNQGFQYNCLYPWHIFLKPEGHEWDVKFIDLEKMKKGVFIKKCIIGDLESLYRNTKNIKKFECIKFLKHYVLYSKYRHVKTRDLIFQIVKRNKRKTGHVKNGAR